MTATTPRVLQVLSLSAIAITLVLYFVVNAAYKQNLLSAQVIGESATSGIEAAQKLSVDLARMDASFAVMATSSGQGGDDFAEARKRVSASLVDAAKNIHFGVAETVPLKRILYVLPLYQTAVTEALNARVANNTVTMGSQAAYAHKLMAEILLPAADQLDEANSTALNNAYNERMVADRRVNTAVLVVGLALAVFLVSVHFYLSRRFRRVINPEIALAAILIIGFTMYANYQFTAISRHLQQAKEDVFQRLHVMYRAQVRAEQARAALLFKQLPGQQGDAYDVELKQAEARILTLPGGVPADEFARQAEAGGAGADATGYLATLARERGSVDDRQNVAAAIRLFGRVLADQPAAAQQNLSEMVNSLGKAAEINHVAFRMHAANALSSLRTMEALAFIMGISVAALSFLGLRARLREYNV